MPIGLNPSVPPQITREQIEALNKILAKRMPGMSVPIVLEASQGDSFVSEVATGSLMMSAFQLPKLIHPINSINSAKVANAGFAEILRACPEIAKLPKVQQGEIFAKLFNAERLSSRQLFSTAATTARGAEGTKALQELYATAISNYKKAVASGNAAEISKCASQLDTILAAGKDQRGFFGKIFGVFKKGPKGEYKTAAEIAESLKGAETAATAAEGTAALAKTTAITTAEVGAATAKGATSWFGKAFEWTKGACKSGGFKAFVAISGAIELLTNVIPAFREKGAGAGSTELLKSAATTVADAGGFCVGAKAGAAGGAALGALLGPAGAAVGGCLGGIIGGIAGACGLRKLTKLFTGKSHSEKKAEEQQQEQQQAILAQALQNPEVQAALFSANQPANPFMRMA